MLRFWSNCFVMSSSYQTSSHYILENVAEWVQTMYKRISWTGYDGKMAPELWACLKFSGGHPILSPFGNIFKNVVKTSLVWWGIRNKIYWTIHIKQLCFYLIYQHTTLSAYCNNISICRLNKKVQRQIDKAGFELWTCSYILVFIR